MLIPDSPRFEFAVKSAHNFVQAEKITTFPVDPFDICERNGWIVLSYSQLAAKLNRKVSDIIDVFSSEEGTCLLQGEQYYIFYNDVGKTKRRIRFTITHEIGHIFLNHLHYAETKISSELCEEKYRVLEDEASVFARNVLSPVYLSEVHPHMFDDQKAIANLFQISDPAAKMRFNLLQADLKYLYS